MEITDLSISSIKEQLPTRYIGQNIIYYPHLPSTMEAARREGKQNAPEGTVIIAGEQTKGRGRLQRAWISPAGNIALSILIYPDTSHLPYLVMIASLATVHGIESVTRLKTQIKWPNDILIKGKKVGGILIENEVKKDAIAYAIVGIGINVAMQPAQFDEIAAVATSLEAETGQKVSREKIIVNILNELERLYSELTDSKLIYEAWRGRLVTLGQKVVAIWGAKTLEGTAESVDESGILFLRRLDGTLTRIIAGDVTLQKKR